MSKKVWLLVCEGDTDREFIVHYHDVIKSKNIKIEIYGGDFLTDWSNKITNQNVIEKISELYSDKLAKLMRRKRISPDDIEKIIYVTDSDRCFELNDNKSAYLYKLSQTKTLKVDDNEYIYQLLVFSDNLEHVTNNVSGKGMDVEEKYDLIDDFCSRYKNKYDVDNYFESEGIYTKIIKSLYTIHVN